MFNWWLSNQLTAVSLNREIILVSTNSNSLMISGRFQDKYICYVVALKSVFAPWWQLSETRTPAALRHPSAIIPTINLWGCHAISQRLPEQKLIFYRSSPGNRDIPITSLFLDQLWELSFTSCHLSAAQSIPRLNVSLLLEKTLPLASVQTAHLFLETTTKDTKCPRGLYRSRSAGERGPWLLGSCVKVRICFSCTVTAAHTSPSQLASTCSAHL